MRSAIEDAVTWWEWLALAVYLALAASGMAWILGAWTIDGGF